MTQAAVTGSMARTAGCCSQGRIAVVLQRGLQQRSDTGWHGDKVDRPLAELRVDLFEQRAVALHDPLRDLLVALPCGVLDEQILRVAGGRTGSGPYHFVVDQVGLHDLGAFAGDCLHGLLSRSRGNVDAGCEPEQRGHSAKARPWFPSVAVTRVTGAERSRSSVRLLAGASKPLRWLSAQFTAQDAPRILKAGNPRRSDSSLTNTAATPSSAASSGSSTERRRPVARHGVVELPCLLSVPGADLKVRDPGREAHGTDCRLSFHGERQRAGTSGLKVLEVLREVQLLEQ